MGRGPLPPDVCWEIALISSAQTRASLLLTSQVAYSLIFPLLYRDVSVGRGADRLVRTLASRPELPPLVTETPLPAVKALIFLSGEVSRISRDFLRANRFSGVGARLAAADEPP
jgi:hypothetical protein